MRILPSYPSFAYVLRYWRKKRNLSQKELERRSGISHHAIFYIEHHKQIVDFTWEQFQAIAEALKISPNTLLCSEPEEINRLYGEKIM